MELSSSESAKNIIDSVREDRQSQFEKGVLGRALKVIAEDVYSKGEHFILELLQNADDNTYAETVSPTIKYILSDKALVVICNEVGMSKEDVESICDVGSSAKKERAACIGEKGFGFKSVFMCSSQPHISSHGFSFKLTTPTYIVPEWVSYFPVEVDPKVTTIFLPFDNVKTWNEDLFDILQPSVLLFLRRLQQISLVWHSLSNPRRKLVFSKQVRDDVTTITSILSDAICPVRKNEHFLVVCKEFDVPKTAFDPRREKVLKAEVACAFKINKAGAAVPDPSSLFFSYLPVRKGGLHFILQANFILTASREDLDQKSPWNCWLRMAAVDTFLHAISEHFKVKPALRNTFYDFLPTAQEVPDDFFHVFSGELLTRLREYPCIQGCSGNWLQPCDALIPLSHARHVLDTVFVADCLGLEFVHESVNLPKHGTILQNLGCRKMMREDVLKCMNHPLFSVSHFHLPGWFLRLYTFLAEVFGGSPRELVHVAMLPVSEQEVVSMASCHTLFFRGSHGPAQCAESEGKLGIKILQAQATPAEGTDALNLLQGLGLMRLSPKAVVLHHILPMYDKDVSCLPPDLLFSHVWYIAEFLKAGGKPLSSEQREIVDACRTRILLRGSDLSYHLPSMLYFSRPCLESVLGTEAVYLHPEYDCIADEVLALLGASEMLRFEMRLQKIPRKEWHTLNKHGFHDPPDSHQHYILEEPHLPEYVHTRALDDPDVCSALIKHLDDNWDSYIEHMKPQLRTFFRSTSGQRCKKHALSKCDNVDCSFLTKASQPGLSVVESVKCLKIKTAGGKLHPVGDCYLKSHSLETFFGDYLNYLPIELTSPGFIEALGLHMDVTDDMLLKFLQSSSEQFPKKIPMSRLEPIRRAYRKLDLEFMEFMESAEILRAKFNERKLILWYEPPSDAPMEEAVKVRWLHPDEARFEANEQGHVQYYAQAVYFLQPLYGSDLEAFFCSKLKVLRNPTHSDRVFIIHDLCRWSWQSGVWSDFVQRQIEFLYKELSCDCRRMESSWKRKRQDEGDIDIDALKRQRIFRTYAGSWASAEDGLLIPDDENLLNDLLKHGCATSIIKVAPSEAHLLRNLADAFNIRFLSEILRQGEIDACVVEQWHEEWSKRLQHVLEPAARCVYHSLREQHDEDPCVSVDGFITDLAERWQGLGTVQCRVVGNLVVTYQLPNPNVPQVKRSCEAFADVSNNRVYISKELAGKADAEVCPVLASQIVKLLAQGELASTKRAAIEMPVFTLLMAAQSLADVSVMFEKSSAMKCFDVLPPQLSCALGSGHWVPKTVPAATPLTHLGGAGGGGDQQFDDGVCNRSSSSSVPLASAQKSADAYRTPSHASLSGFHHSEYAHAASTYSTQQFRKRVKMWPRPWQINGPSQDWVVEESKFPGIFWLLSQADAPTMLCIDATRHKFPENFFSCAHNLMTRILGHSDVSFESCPQRSKLDTVLRAHMGDSTYLKSCSACFHQHGMVHGVAIGRNRKILERTAKLALAFTAACRQDPELPAGLPAEFCDYVDNLKETLHQFKPCSNKRLRQDPGLQEQDDALNLQVVENELDAIMSVDGSDVEGDQHDAPAGGVVGSFALDRSISAFRSCLAQGLLQLTRSLSRRSCGGADDQHNGVSFLRDTLKEDAELRTSLVCAGTRYLHEVHEAHNLASRIFKQNHGPQALLGHRPDIVRLEERFERISNLRYTHNMISAIFRHGHSGEPVSGLIDKLNAGDICHSEIPCIVVAPLDGSFYAVTGNRRLYALKSHAEHVKKDLKVKVLAARHLCPITAKLMMSFSTKNKGVSVQIRT